MLQGTWRTTRKSIFITPVWLATCISSLHQRILRRLSWMDRRQNPLVDWLTHTTRLSRYLRCLPLLSWRSTSVLQHLGGIHSGCAICGFIWLIFRVASSIRGLWCVVGHWCFNKRNRWFHHRVSLPMGSKYPPQVSQPLLFDIPSLASLNGTIGLWDGEDMEQFSSLTLI